MLDILGTTSTYCDGISRRSFLRIGALGVGAGALTLSDLYRMEANGQTSSSHKAVIQIFLGGGPPHQDMWDVKSDAPAEIRGEFQAIDTNVPGIQVCEVFPRVARHMDKSVLIRSIVGSTGEHAAFQCLTGWQRNSMQNVGGRPCIGASLSKLYGQVDRSVPPFVGLAARTQHGPWSESGNAGFLGPAYGPFRPDGPGMANMTLNGITLDRLQDRRGLLSAFDRFKSEIDSSGTMAGTDAYGARALDVLTSSKLLDALDLSKEDPDVVARYGDGKPYNFQYDGAPTVNDQLLVARRLIEAGVRCVTLTYGRWDSHSKNFDLVRDHGGKLDQALSALIEDLDQRGMLSDTTVIAWGEFGRTPRVNDGGGRDHWPQVSAAFLAGGGMRTGQVVGATNRLGEYAKERPVQVQEVVSTLYHNLGVDTATTTLADPTGRPAYLTEVPCIQELI